MYKKIKRLYSHYIILSVLLLGSSLLSAPHLYAAEEATSDVYASVTVNRIFKISLDETYISFGRVDPGQTVELHEARPYNRIRCASNKGIPWYLKISILGDIQAPPDSGASAGNFKWRVVGSSGDGTVHEGWHSFSKERSTAYTGGPNDMTGYDVDLLFKYRLDLPGNATGGHYSLRVVYTMTETP